MEAKEKLMTEAEAKNPLENRRHLFFQKQGLLFLLPHLHLALFSDLTAPQWMQRPFPFPQPNHQQL